MSLIGDPIKVNLHEIAVNYALFIAVNNPVIALIP